MRKLLFLTVLIVVGLVVWFLTTRESSKTVVEVSHQGVFEDAFKPADLGKTGPAWPDDPTINALRSAWSALGPADSTRMEHLVLQWIYPEGQTPNRITNLAQVDTGQDLTIEERLAFGNHLVEHPEWRVGTARHYPAAAAVLTSSEKRILELLKDGKVHTPLTIQRDLGLSSESVNTHLDGLVRVGWVVSDPEKELQVSIADPQVCAGGAMQFVQMETSKGEVLDLACVMTALVKYRDTLNTTRVSLTGACAQTGKPIKVSIVAGRLRTGKPGGAVAAEVKTFGLTSGLFASDEAFETWKEANPDVSIAGARVPGFFRQFLDAS